MTGSYKKRLGIVAVIMALLVIAAVLITVLTGLKQTKENRLSIVTTFMPVYTSTLRLTEGVDGVAVTNLAPAKTGCLHDYQLTPDNAIALTKADALVLNGAGAESFLNNAGSQYPNLYIIDTSDGITPIESDHDDHHHHGDECVYNEHIWTSPSNYIKQIENLRDSLIEIDSEYSEQYQKNASKYISEIQSIKSELQQAISALPTLNCILFHDSLSYFAKEFGLNPIATFSMGEESTLSAGQLASAAQAAQNAGKVLLLYDNQYEIEYSSVAEKATFSRVLKLDTAVIEDGASPKNVWLNAMRKNLELIKKAANPS
jgi:zinc transport system substrate-binding protein